ncbi:molecular chaperone HtpG [Candidatus Izimaplasma bacterium ZiA1]|uniref:molecular chaperone HtpG n=1 Tax=Candidatus Izimoplasma sp. ZiA1 TaxID=2024899 RepID=UPI000BAA8135|nr:molecular chaperone HtpG [Candidatus Izimaplasma bacterium ZiA1]
MAKKRQFQTESKRLLDLMINSIYTHKEIFLRELISNASDAIDKRHYNSLTDASIAGDDYNILIEKDEDLRTLTITDNGIGLTEDELISNLGIIAKSGTKEFKENIKDLNDLEIIGQFGVGFYSAFMVSKKVTVYSKSVYSEKGYKWESTGTETYTIDECDITNPGTKIVLSLRDNSEELEEDFDEYLKEYKIKELVKKYSDYIRYPIKTETTNYNYSNEDNEEPTVTKSIEIINSMIPLWKKSKNDIEEKELFEFYQHQFNDFQDPLFHLHSKVEGNLSFTSLLFVPKKAPYDLYTEKFEKGLMLYTNGVMIMEKTKELLPDYLRFVKGLVDSNDLSLNISREMLQQDKQLKKIAVTIEKKILNELEKMLKRDRELYNEFYNVYGVNLKYGIYDNFGAKKDDLKELILFKTTNNDDLITLKEYTESLLTDQKYIYYASGKNKAQINALPQMDLIKDKGYNVLMLTDDVDEFMINVLSKYNEIEFKSINQGDLDLKDEELEEQVNEKQEVSKGMLEGIKEALGDKITDVKLSKRLKDSPVCLVSTEGVSLEMEKVLNNMPIENQTKAQKVLEINPNHDLFKALENLYENDKSLLADYSDLLYNQALMIEGMQVENPVEFSNRMVKLMIIANKKNED